MANEILTMTVTEALAKVKAWNKQVEAYWGTQGRMIFGIVAGDAQTSLIGGYTTEQLATKIQRDVDGIEELLRKIYLLKNAISKSNAETTVTIGGQSYTVAQAVIMKNALLPHKKALLAAYRKAFVATAGQLATSVKEDTDRINKLVEASMIVSGDNTEALAERNAKKAAEIRAEQIKDTGPRLYDPKNIKDRIDVLDKEITDFETNVDFTLSTNNATTSLTVTF